MPQEIRIGVQIVPYDPFWVQVREAVYKKIQQLGLVLIPIEFSKHPGDFTTEEQIGVFEELMSQKLDAIICWNLPENLLNLLLSNKLPAIYISESFIRHPLFVSPKGLYEGARMVGKYFSEKLNGKGRVLSFGGLLEPGGDKGINRIDGFHDEISLCPQITYNHLPSYWRYDQSYPIIRQYLQDPANHVDAVFALSDPLALAVRDAVKELGIKSPILIAGVNGDPQALVAIADGTISATIETLTDDFGSRAVELANQAALKLPLPDHFEYKPSLITKENVNQSIRRKLLAIADIPNRLVGFNKKLENDRIVQLEISNKINRRIGSLLDRHELSQEITKLICDNYGYDHIELYWYSQESHLFILNQSDSSDCQLVSLTEDQAGILYEAIVKDAPIFIPDMHFNIRFMPDPRWPDTHSRVILPIHFGHEILGVLDLHCNRNVPHLKHELIGLQLLADHLGIAIRNANLYTEAVQARAAAEKANQLKTRLLANVGHELRTPLNVIMGYNQAVLDDPNPYHTPLPQELIKDQQIIHQSSEHLKRLINDLLDLSRAEIEELDLYPEKIKTRVFFEEVFNSMASTTSGEIEWKLILPKRLPVIQADPVRLRQILLNLLSNAKKFTQNGSITLGAEVLPPHLHFWIEDTGIGIPIELQEQIFEPFVTIEQSGKRAEGIGLGLSITRRLVMLHGGAMSLDSHPGKGSIFHIYLPFPTLSGKTNQLVANQPKPVILMLSSKDESIPPALHELALSQNLSVQRIQNYENLHQFLQKQKPCVLAWDLANSHYNDWRLIETIRNQPEFCHLPFIFYDQDDESPSGLTNVLTKPINIKTVSEYIHSLHSSSGPVLIIDDDPEIRTLYYRLVNEALPGFNILTAEDGMSGLKIITETIPGLIILDLVMPKMDGFTFLEKVRTNPATRQVPVLIMSGKLLTYEDLKKLDYAKTTFHLKGILSPDEAVTCLQKSFDSQNYLPQPTSILVKQVLVFLHQNYGSNFSRKDVADSVKVSENYLTTIFRQELDMTPWDCLNRIRVQKAKELLSGSSETMTSVAYKVGFDDPAYFSRVFRKYAGQSPQAFRDRKPKNQTIAHH